MMMTIVDEMSEEAPFWGCRIGGIDTPGPLEERIPFDSSNTNNADGGVWWSLRWMLSAIFNCAHATVP